MARILHFGLGNFHRAHQAIYTAIANEETGSDWTITGVSQNPHHPILRLQDRPKGRPGTTWEMHEKHLVFRCQTESKQFCEVHLTPQSFSNLHRQISERQRDVIAKS